MLKHMRILILAVCMAVCLAPVPVFATYQYEYYDPSDGLTKAVPTEQLKLFHSDDLTKLQSDDTGSGCEFGVGGTTTWYAIDQDHNKNGETVILRQSGPIVIHGDVNLLLITKQAENGGTDDSKRLEIRAPIEVPQNSSLTIWSNQANISSENARQEELLNVASSSMHPAIGTTDKAAGKIVINGGMIKLQAGGELPPGDTTKTAPALGCYESDGGTLPGGNLGSIEINGGLVEILSINADAAIGVGCHDNVNSSQGTMGFSVSRNAVIVTQDKTAKGISLDGESQADSADWSGVILKAKDDSNVEGRVYGNPVFTDFCPFSSENNNALNGKTVSVSVPGDTSLTLCGQSASLQIGKSGHLLLDDGNVSFTDGAQLAVKKGSVTIKSGTMRFAGEAAKGFQNLNITGGKLVINGGRLELKEKAWAKLVNEGELERAYLELNGGVLELDGSVQESNSNNPTLSFMNSDFKISGGDIEGTGTIKKQWGKGNVQTLLPQFIVVPENLKYTGSELDASICDDPDRNLKWNLNGVDILEKYWKPVKNEWERVPGFTLNGKTVDKVLDAGKYAVTYQKKSPPSKTVSKTFTVAPKLADQLELAGHITAPALGGAAQRIIQHPQYTGSVQWQPAAQSFAPSTAYTAVITLTPTSNYTFTGLAENAFSYNGKQITSTAGGDTVTVTIAFPKTAAPPPEPAQKPAATPIPTQPTAKPSIKPTAKPEASAMPVEVISTSAGEQTVVETQLPENLTQAEQKIAQQLMQAVETSAEAKTPLVKAESLAKAAQAVLPEIEVTQQEAKEALKDLKMTKKQAENVRVVAQPYMNIKVVGVKQEEGKPASFVVNLTPMLRTLATFADVGQPLQTTGESRNAMPVGAARELTITEPTEVTLPLPTDFAQKDKALFITCKNYVYTGTVAQQEDISLLTFEARHGFADFEIMQENPAVASIGDLGYLDLAAALAEIESGETIQLTRASGATFQIDRETSFTFAGEAFTGKIVAGPGYQCTQNGNTYTVTAITQTEESALSEAKPQTEKAAADSSALLWIIPIPILAVAGIGLVVFIKKRRKQ